MPIFPQRRVPAWLAAAVALSLPLVSLPLVSLPLLAQDEPKAPDPDTGGNQPEPPEPAPEPTPPVKLTPLPDEAVDSIKAAEGKSHVYFLAGKRCEGRASGLPGCDKAGEYIIEHLKEWGYAPAGDDGTFKQTLEVRVLPFPGQSRSMDDVKGQMAPTWNVCARLEGRDERLRSEYVVLSAHYDHVGQKSKKKTYFGADDNASGTAALLEVAQALMTTDVRPRRSILILFFTAEERGLLGSKHFCDRPTVPLQSIVCDLNIDMVGRNEAKEIYVYGNGTSPDLDSAHIAALEQSGLEAIPKAGSIFLRSDQYNFYERDIPCLFWTSGLHKDYHSTSDIPRRINVKKLARAAVQALVTAWTIAEREERPRFVKLDENAAAGPLGAVLDVLPFEAAPEEAKLSEGTGIALVRSVMEDMPAEKAGLKQGDMIIGLGKKALPDSDPVGFLEDTFAEKKRKKYSLRVLRGGKKKLRLTVKL